MIDYDQSEVAVKPLAQYTDEEIAKLLRTIDKDAGVLMEELNNRGYTIYARSDDGEEYEQVFYSITSISKEEIIKKEI